MLRTNKQRGFTLLEVMVALFILAVTAGALSRIASQSTSSSYQLEIRQHASWVAQNQLTLILLGTEQNLDGKSSFAGYVFNWRAAKSSTEHENFQRVTISISLPELPDYILAELTGFTHHE